MKKELLQLWKNQGNARNKVDYIIDLIFLCVLTMLLDNNIKVNKHIPCK